MNSHLTQILETFAKEKHEIVCAWDQCGLIPIFCGKIFDQSQYINI